MVGERRDRHLGRWCVELRAGRRLKKLRLQVAARKARLGRLANGVGRDFKGGRVSVSAGRLVHSRIRYLVVLKV
jgi:hypothetical protein